MKVNLQGQVQPTLLGWACGPQVVKAGAKDLSTLTCGVPTSCIDGVELKSTVSLSTQGGNPF